jgi:DNA-binding HxlR family transcriptional regulator
MVTACQGEGDMALRICRQLRGNRTRARAGGSTANQQRGKRPERAASAAPDPRAYLQSIIDVRQLAGGEWSWDVMVALQTQPAQYSDLLAAIQKTPLSDIWPGRKHLHLRDATLTRTLRRLEQAELVARVRDTEFPYHTTYRLTAPAHELLDAMLPMTAWAQRHQSLIERTRKRRHGEQSDQE